MLIYGFIDNSGDFVEVGKSERGAKCAASKRGYQNTRVGYRSNINNMFVETALRVNGKWVGI